MADVLMVVAMCHEPGKIPNPCVVPLCLLVRPVEEVDGLPKMFARDIDGAIVEAIGVVEGVHIDVHLYHLLKVRDLMGAYGILEVVEIAFISLKIESVCCWTVYDITRMVVVV